MPIVNESKLDKLIDYATQARHCAAAAAVHEADLDVPMNGDTGRMAEP